MPQIAIPGTLRASVKLTRGDESIVNVWHLDKPAGYNDAAAAAIANVMLSFYENTTAEVQQGIRHWLSNDILIGECSIVDISAVPYGNPVIRIDAVAGTETADILPLQTALVVTLRTSLGSRRGRGRVFLGGFTEAAADETSGYPRPDATFMQDVGDAMTGLMTGLADLEAELQVASYADEDSRNVLSWQIKNVWRTQRRRAKSVAATAIVSG